jgi:transposase-like protein
VSSSARLRAWCSTNYSHTEAARSLGLVESALRRWVNQLQQERGGVTPTSKALPPEQQKIQELEARINRLEREKSIIKKATPLMPNGVILRSRVSELFTQSRSAAGSRSIVLMMKEDGMQIGRFKVRKLMREMNLISKQPGSHAYKKAPWSDLVSRTYLIASSAWHPPTRSGAVTSRMFGPKVDGSIWQR